MSTATLPLWSTTIRLAAAGSRDFFNSSLSQSMLSTKTKTALTRSRSSRAALAKMITGLLTILPMVTSLTTMRSLFRACLK